MRASIYCSACLLALTAPVFSQTATGVCATNSVPAATAKSPTWANWGGNLSNTRFQADAQIPANRVDQLKVKWAFGFAGARSVGQPVVDAGRIYLGVDTGNVYSLDASSGCQYWTYKADASVRTAVTLARVANKTLAFFGDLRANVYAVDASTGALVWKVKADDHASARITAGAQLYEGRLYVPISSGEEGSGGGANYACCTFRGSVVALDAASGKQIWKTYVIREEPKAIGTDGKHFAPAGAAIWNTPTIDTKRGALYVGTGNEYSDPASTATDSVVAMDLKSGAIRWSVQDTENDVWLSTCMGARKPEHCGPDHDFGSPPMLKTVAGRDLLIAGQKSGNVWAHDPDNKGKVVWRAPLVDNTTEFGGKIIWGGAVDNDTAYFGLGTGGIGAVNIRNGERKWFTPLAPSEAMKTHGGQDGPVTVIPGLVFSGGWDGLLRALSSKDGKIVWQFDTAHDFPTVNGVTAKGGSMGAAGPVVAGRMLLVPSGYPGVKGGVGGNVLLAFEIPQ
jgi:polyvinyl alcohol dehydrogenase (cytochrome)